MIQELRDFGSRGLYSQEPMPSLERRVLKETNQVILQHSRRSAELSLELYEAILPAWREYTAELRAKGYHVVDHPNKDGMFIVAAAAILHDIGWYMVSEEERMAKHGVAGAKYVVQNLPSTGNIQTLTHIAVCVRHHGLEDRAPFLTPEGVAVSDGDKIDFLLTHPRSPLFQEVYAKFLYLDLSRQIVDAKLEVK